ncbi:MAG: polyhydroxyalkanoate synthase, partial [Paraglaciecola sp.]
MKNDVLFYLYSTLESMEWMESKMKYEDSQQQVIDKIVHAAMAKLTSGLSPSALMAAYSDWAVHLASSPGKRAHLIEKGNRKLARLAGYLSECTSQLEENLPCIEPLPIDKRFTDSSWQKWPFNLLYQSFLLNQQWWSNATTDVRGVTEQHENVMEFSTRQILDVFSPSNYLLTNPQLLEQTQKEGGQNLVRGAQNFLNDLLQTIGNKKSTAGKSFMVGEQLGITPGK